MDNASFHRSELLAEMCAEAAVKLVYLPPYSPDLNPIEDFFAELKGFIKRNWSYYERDSSQGFYFASNGVSMWSVQKKKVPKVIFAMQAWK